VLPESSVSRDIESNSEMQLEELRASSIWYIKYSNYEFIQLTRRFEWQGPGHPSVSNPVVNSIARLALAVERTQDHFYTPGPAPDKFVDIFRQQMPVIELIARPILSDRKHGNVIA
jgi:hypothetical protein